MKVLQINASYKPAYIYGGPTMSVSQLSEQLSRAGCQVEVYTTTANGATELPVVANKQSHVDGVLVTYFKRLTKDHTHFSLALLNALQKKVKDFDVVHIHAWWNPISVLSCFIALFRGVPVIVSPRGMLSSYSFTNRKSPVKKLLHSLVGKRLLRRAHIHVTSSREKDSLEHIIQPKNIFNIPNFVALPPVSPNEKPKPSDVLRLLFFSRIDEKKGLDILIKALSEVTISYHLTIAGDGDPMYIASLRLMVKANKLEDHITWIGFQGANKFDILSDHDLMILPSHDENFGNVVIESLSVGTPVLISTHVGLADYVAKNNLGWICDLNIDNISYHINHIKLENDKLLSITERAPQLIRDDFNESLLVEKYISMYHQIIHND